MSSKATKRHALQQIRAWNARPERVHSELFEAHPFFDPEDKAQVKYEMLRQRELENAPLVDTCRDFGFTRESYRQIIERFRSEGMAGLFERKRGRQQPLKLNDEVRQWLLNERDRDSTLTAEQLLERCEQQLGVRISRRSLYRVLGTVKGQKKKRRSVKPKSS